MRSLPQNPTEWLSEIADAYVDAFEALPFMPLVGMASDESVLFHLAPRVAIKFRRLSDQQIEVATEAALCSYIASKDQAEGSLDDPHLAFSFCYLAAQFGLEIVSEQTISEVMEFIEENSSILAQAINQRTRKMKKRYIGQTGQNKSALLSASMIPTPELLTSRSSKATVVPPQLMGIIDDVRRYGIDTFTLEYSRDLVMASFSSLNHATEIDFKLASRDEIFLFLLAGAPDRLAKQWSMRFIHDSSTYSLWIQRTELRPKSRLQVRWSAIADGIDSPNAVSRVQV